MGFARALKGDLVVGAWAFHGNPYDGPTLHEQLAQTTIVMQDSAARLGPGYRMK